MPISLENSSNIRVTYNTGSNYIIETVKSDVFVRGTTSGNLSSEPTVSPSIRSDIVVESFTYTGTANTKDYTKVFSENTQCDILVVGGGGAGGYSYVGGGGGAGGYVYVQNITLNGSYTINVGNGGAITTGNGNNGVNSSIIGPNVSYIALGGGGGAGGSVSGVVSGTGNNGGSGGGGSYRQLSQVPASGGTSIQFSTYGYGNGGNGGSYGSPWFYGGGGGGAGGSVSGASGTGANGLPNTITGVSVTYAGGGGAGSDGATPFQGGTGGGGRGASGDGSVAAIAGTDGLGGGGGGAKGNGTGSAAKGGSGIVIVKYKYNNDNQRYRLHFPRKTKVQFILNGDGNRIQLNNDLHGTYIITMTSTNSIIEKEGGRADEKQVMPSNKLEIIYELFDTLDNINSTFTDSLTTTKPTPINVYNNTLSLINNGIPFEYNKYNKFKITGYIPKANKNGNNNINFNIVLTSPDPKDTSRLIDMSKDLYSIRYEFQSLQSENEITPIDIYITMKPKTDINTISNSKFAFKTYFRSSGSGLNSSEIQVFLSNRSKPTSINSFNNISDWITDLSNKNIWGLSTMDTEISDIIRNLLSVDNIDNKCKNDNTIKDLIICDIRKLIYIKNKITPVLNTSSPSLIKNVSSVNVFPRNSPYVNFNIDDYISYESSTLIAPQQRTTTFDIKSTATKYMYFYMGAVS